MKLPEDSLDFSGELTVVSPSGAVSRIEAAGNSLHWVVTSIPDLTSDIGFDRKRAAGMARVLDRLGANLELIEDGQVMLTMGRGPSSILGWILTGSSKLRVRRPLRWLTALRMGRT